MPIKAREKSRRVILEYRKSFCHLEGRTCGEGVRLESNDRELLIKGEYVICIAMIGLSGTYGFQEDEFLHS